MTDNRIQNKENLKNRTQPMQNPDWFPLEFFTQGVEVDFVLVIDMIF